ncbi:Beach domain-containing protein b [Thalictrum thalictroides]|uniref:Beach domain-containing protein b n=1 Tax=Thalictrum thalictroides TaxID=46969 RepID=A0A7J6VEC3_THATH|nr:Beach domain-containing protein b [Thalictrum thalictroides]
MNIVKGVADLLRRTSSFQAGESGSWSQGQKFATPSPRICFSEVEEEAILGTLWRRYEDTIDKVEKRKLFYVFLKQFLIVYKDWEPAHAGQVPEAGSSTTAEYLSGVDDIVIGCSAGHPAEIILILTQEIAELTSLVSKLHTSTEPTTDLRQTSVSLNIITEGFPVLDALAVITRSMHNCKVFGYYGGMQKLTALMKAAVVQLKTFTGALVDENLSNNFVEKSKLLQKILLHVITVICCFIDLNSHMYERAVEFSLARFGTCLIDPPRNVEKCASEARLHWHQKAIVSVMEAGGLNWLVELLRVMRRLSMKEQWTDMTLQYLTLTTLKSALSENPRGQNHFRSIGGLEVLLDGLGFLSNKTSTSKSIFGDDMERNENTFLAIFELQVLSLEVLREAVFGNLSNLQFLCENGRVHKFANNICWPAFAIQEFKHQRVQSYGQANSEMPVLDSEKEIHAESSSRQHVILVDANGFHLESWNDYAVKLSIVLCSFLLALEDIRFHSIQAIVGRSAVAVSSLYWELSIKWVMKVLLTVFPCIKACSNQNELPGHLRVFVNTLQHYILYSFRKVLVSLPTLLQVFREEGMWDLLFSENFFYFGASSEGISGDFSRYNEGILQKIETCSSSASAELKVNEVEILKLEILSFVEFAATFNGAMHNLPECSVLMDALEQSACNPELANVLAKSLHRILQLATEQSAASFKSLDAISRLLKVVCIQAQEFRRCRNNNLVMENKLLERPPHQNGQSSGTSEMDQCWLKCMETSLDLFKEYLSLADDARSLVLHNSTCIDCLFDLFWEEALRKFALTHILDLMKLPPSSDKDQVAKLYLCSKYLETFTCVKEREKNFADLSIDLLLGVREMLETNQVYYQALFCDGECFLHIVSLLNGSLDDRSGKLLVLNVLQTLTSLLCRNEVSKVAFRALVGKGYQTLQNLLLDVCESQPSKGLLSALLDMLVDGNFDVKATPIIKNEDVIMLFLSVLQKSSESLRHFGLNVFQQLLKDSISNRASCVRAGMLNFLLEWFPQEDDNNVILEIAQLIQVIGGHSISGKDIRKIFALLRNGKIGSGQLYCSLLLTSMLSMFKEKGPIAFFDLNGSDSGIVIKTPLQWPHNKGFSFTCWVRVENFPRTGTMGLFSFLTENGRGCSAAFGKDKLFYESINQKQQCVPLQHKMSPKKWHFLCITHSIGRAFSGGSLLRCYIDGALVSSEKCRYSKVSDPLIHCTIGRNVTPLLSAEEFPMVAIKDTSPFLGQIGPVYMFNDAISLEQIQGIYSLGPSYMYSFLDNEVAYSSNNTLLNGIFDARDGLASKINIGLNAQACDGKTLFNVAPVLDHTLDKSSFEAVVMTGTQLCSRRLLQQIIYCVGGVSVFFPLLTQFDSSEYPESGQLGDTLLRCVIRECLTAEVIELIASVLDENLANQQQMHLLSGFSILGFLLQSVPPQKINLETISALIHLYNVVANCGMSELLVREAISSIFLNPFIWVYTAYKVQLELYMFLIQQFDYNPTLLSSLCCLPRIIDIIHQFYWDKTKSRSAYGSKPLLDPISKEVIGERPSHEDVRKIRLLLLSLGEMSLRQSITAADIKSLVAFFERSQDMACIEDVLHMVTRAISQKPLFTSFLEQVNLIGGCHIFINLLRREFEPVRLLSLQFVGRLMVGLPSEKKGPRFFNLSTGRSRSLSESHKKINIKLQPIVSAMSDRLFKFSQTDLLCATLFDVLLGGASPRQVLQKNNQPERNWSKGSNSHFFLPQMLVLIFKFLSNCQYVSTKAKILTDLVDLLDSNPLNIEALVEYSWHSWLATSVKLDVFKTSHSGNIISEQYLVRKVFCVVLSYYTHSVKGGWHQLEETVNFLLWNSEESKQHWIFIHEIFDDLAERLVVLSSEDNIFVAQPCRDNTLYLLKLIDEMLIFETEQKLPYPESNLDLSSESLEFGSHIDSNSRTVDSFYRDVDKFLPSDRWWNLYDKIWLIIAEMNGKGPSRMLPKSSSSGGPSLGQRARGLVESLNVPAAEMAAVVVSGSIGSALGGKPNKTSDKAMILRGEKCPRIVFRLVILYLCKSSLERASKCVQQVISLLPCLLTADDEHSKSRLQLFVWSLLTVRSQYGTLDDGARFHVISRLIRETVNTGKSMLATSIAAKDDLSDSSSNMKEAGNIHTLIQKDRVVASVLDEVKYMKTSKADRTKQVQELRVRMHENSSAESFDMRAFEDETQSTLSRIMSSDDSRRAAFQLAHDEDQQIVAEKWVHIFRTLIDERGPWSANPFPNTTVTYWKLDKTEDSWRRRPKLRRNYHFDEKLCHPSPTVPSKEAIDIVKEDKSGFGSHIPEKMRRFLLKGVRRITDEAAEPVNDTEPSDPKVSSLYDPTDVQCTESVKDNTDHKEAIQDRKESSSNVSETERSEVLLSIPCVLVTPKRKVAGHLAVMKHVLHFFGEFLVEGTGGSSVFNNFNPPCNSEYTKPEKVEGVDRHTMLQWPPNLCVDYEKSRTSENPTTDHEPLLSKLPKIKRHRRWSVSRVKSVHLTRYLLRYTAIEIFFDDSVAPVFFNFASHKAAKDVGNLIVSTRNDSLFTKGSSRDRIGTISFVDRRVALEMAVIAQECWKRRDMTNFEYLMILNTLAGRSYNDLTQYPVFPWILADYSSEKLDFNKSSTFRDLTKPVGALDSRRFEVFEDRYRNFSDPDIPSFYYGSHYSSMGIVLFYLLRLEPFTSLHRNLQGGKFDHADRLFQSIEGTYRNCLSNTSDVKELIPEFFYMPDFLANSNSYHLGVKQDGDPLGDVCLPPWAKGSAEEFIHTNREALESEYVSSNLHHWIDLVFGYKQRGKSAVEAANIFYYLTYEGAVDLDTMEDELQRNAIEDQIANFGQTPVQIFRKKHPRRGPPIPILRPLYFAPGSINLTSVVANTTHPPSAVLYISILDSNIVLVSQGLTMSVKMWLTTQLQSGGNFTFSGSQDPFFGIGSVILSSRRIASPLAENIELGAQFFAAMQTPSGNFLVACGNWENSFQVISLNDGQTVQTVRHHKDVVSCVAVASDGSILATGSYDTTVMVWEVSRVKATEKKVRTAQMEFPRKDYIIVETPFHILCGHDDIITCLFVSVELDILISGSKDGTCIFHTLREGRYVRSLQHPSGSALSKLVASRHGRIVCYAEDDLSLNMYSINGKHIATSESNGRLNCVELSNCGEFLVCAGDQGQIVVRSMNSLEVVKRYDGIGKVITSLTVTPEECFLAGTKDGSLLVYSIDNPQLRKSSLPRNLKSKSSAVG